MNLFNRVCAYLCVFLFVCFVGTAGKASAATIDFASGDWAGAHNQFTHTVGDTTATANPLLVTALYHSSDGLGVNGWLLADTEQEEINGLEWLAITFAQPMAITNFSVNNLFPERTWLGQKYNELGWYSLDGDNWTSFEANDASGQLTVDVGGAISGSIYFAPYIGFNPLFRGDEFTLASINVDAVAPPAVPEPATMTLLGLGLLGAGYTTRRRRRNSAA